MNVQIKRVYESADPRDGFRVLVDRLWPRGLSKESAKIDLWVKDLAPYCELSLGAARPVTSGRSKYVLIPGSAWQTYGIALTQ